VSTEERTRFGDLTPRVFFSKVPVRFVTVEHLLCIISRLEHCEGLHEPNKVVVSTVNLVIEHGRDANGLAHQAVKSVWISEAGLTSGWMAARTVAASRLGRCTLQDLPATEITVPACAPSASLV
jgi:hypothetical protein